MEREREGVGERGRERGRMSERERWREREREVGVMRWLLWPERVDCVHLAGADALVAQHVHYEPIRHGRSAGAEIRQVYTLITRAL